MMSLSASTTALSTQRFVFGNGRVRSGAAASSRNVVGASKTTVTRRARANWARTVSAVGNGIEPSRSTGAARDPKRDSKRGGSMGINAVADPDRRTFGSSDEDSPSKEFPAMPQPKQVKKRLTKSERENIGESYEWSAWVSTCGVTSIAITATYLRLLREVTDAGGFPWAELFAQLALVAGAAVGMEYYARYAHKYLWHDSLWTMPLKARKEWNRPVWLLHESHHLPREGAFEANDIFAIANGVPAFALCAYGFLTPGVFGGACFGVGLGITFFGIAYMYVHDGMVHKRFPTGPLGKLPFLRKIAAGHTIHHTEAFDGVPWGLFLSTQELAKCPGGLEELETVLEAAERKMQREEEEERRMNEAGAQSVHFSVWPREGMHIPSEVSAPACKLPEE